MTQLNAGNWRWLEFPPLENKDMCLMVQVPWPGGNVFCLCTNAQSVSVFTQESRSSYQPGYRTLARPVSSSPRLRENQGHEVLKAARLAQSLSEAPEHSCMTQHSPGATAVCAALRFFKEQTCITTRAFDLRMKRAEKDRLNRVQVVREGTQDLIKTYTNQNVCHIWLYWNTTYSNGLNDPFMTPWKCLPLESVLQFWKWTKSEVR